jgi:hypothetical protein
MVQQTLMQRWFPKKGDLVAVPAMIQKAIGIKERCSYGLVIRETAGSDFPGVWWDILFDGVMQSLHIQVISPLFDKEGGWLKQ